VSLSIQVGGGAEHMR